MNCEKGHPLIESNIYRYSDNGKLMVGCRRCHKTAYERQRKQRLRERSNGNG